VAEYNMLRATYCLRFLIDAFSSSRRYVIDGIASEFSAFLLDAVEAHSTNVLGAKVAVEAAGILGDSQASEIISSALQTGNYWVMETAIRAARNIQNISRESLGMIK